MWETDALDTRVNTFFERSARLLLSLLIVAILMAVLAGVLYTFYDLRLILTLPFHSAFKAILVDILTVLAVVELLRTALAYFSEGRVKVTYIIDTVMVTVLTEVMGFWYKEMPWQQLAMVILLTVSLAMIRVVAVRYSPRSHRSEL
ncbi:MAG TPA: phosphate-starvation-inducible PsiE family protein [Geomonas sp.]|nr:phosphate-starvation-inducible PsiE family protein [Geomonas sp.]